MTILNANVDTSHLGRAVGRYAAPREDFYKSLLILVFLLGGALAFILSVTVMIALTERLLDVLLISAVVVLLLGYPVLRLVRFAVRLLAVRTIHLFTRGFVVEEGDAAQVWHWDDIDTFYIRVTRLGIDYLPDTDAVRDSARLNFLLIVQRPDGTRFELESAVRQMKEVANGIGKRLAVHKLDSVRQHIATNGSYNFGRLIVEQDRMTYDNIGYRWYPLKRVAFGYAEQMVVIQDGAPRPRPVLPVSAIPNVHLLMLLLAPHAEVIDLDGRRVDLERWRGLM